MIIGPRSICLVVAAVLFLVAALAASPPRVKLVPMGLAFLAVGLLL